MFFDEYQALTEKTVNKNLGVYEKIDYFVYGLAGETGEVIELLKKYRYHKHPLHIEDLKSELGDVLWHVARLAAAHELSLEDVAVANIEKLKKRYPDGFTEERSLNRTE